jgi:hypothetical protein
MNRQENGLRSPDEQTHFIHAIATHATWQLAWAHMPQSVDNGCMTYNLVR